MRRNLLASTALTTSTTLITGAAWAADLPVKAPPPPAVVPYSWSGCYAGLNAGGASTSIRQNVTVPGIVGFDSNGNETSFTGGGQIGCNWQVDPRWVLGIEGDIDYLHASRSQTLAFRTAFAGSEDIVGSQQTTLRWLGTVRGRFGYVWDRAFYYATGGLAFGEVDSSAAATITTVTPNPSYSGSYSATRIGWTAGGGVEYAITDRISGKLEYLYFDLGNASYNVVQRSGFIISGGPTTWSGSAKLSGNIIRVGLNFKLTP
jgi:outer membrane immunogenic protein